MEPLNVARTFFDGEELVTDLVEAAEEDGATFYYRTEAVELLVDDAGAATGIRARTDDGLIEYQADVVIVGAGGYESSEEKRTRYYGSDYDAMKVRGSRYNTGEAIDMLIDEGANAVGQWGGAHMALIDSASPDVEGGANRVDGYQFGVLINNNGERFFDEGEDARAHTYAKLGRIIFEEPGHVAYIVVDDPLKHHMRATGPSDSVVGDSVEAVLEKLGSERPERGEATIEEFNMACDPGEFHPDNLDGNNTEGLDIDKSNGHSPSTNRPSTATVSQAASHLDSVASQQTQRREPSTLLAAPSLDSTLPETLLADSFSTIILVALDCRTPQCMQYCRRKCR